jgi:hypothetical protein
VLPCPDGRESFFLRLRAARPAARRCKTSVIASVKFFNWSLTKGQKQAVALDYVPLPAPLVKRIQGYMAANIK